MPIVQAQYAIQMKFSGSAGDWTTVTDVLLNPPITCQYGIRGTGPNDRVAATGTLTFALNNSLANSGGKLGYYSPDNTNVRAGFELGIGVRAALTYSGSTFYKFTGTLEEIGVVPGIYDARVVQCTAVDWMDEAAKQRIRLLTTQVNQRGDQVIGAVVAAMTRLPAASALNAGDDTFPYAIDNNVDLTDSPMKVFQDVADSELGFVYLKGDQTTGGVLTFLDRHGRPSSPSSSASFNDSMVGMTPKRSRASIYNDVKAVVHPRRVDTAASLLFQLRQAQSIAAGSTLTLQGQYTDPSGGNAIRAGALTTCTLTVNTDYKVWSASDASGSDLTASAVVAASFGANAFRASVQNPTKTAGWLTTFQVRGRGLYDYEPVVIESIDTLSTACYGNNVLTLDMPYQSDGAGTGQSAADFMLQVWGKPFTRVELVDFVGNNSDALMNAGLNREPSDRITLTETVTGINGDYYIQGIDWSIDGANTFHFGWLVIPIGPFAYWLIGTVGSSEIGTTTRVGY